MAEQGTYSSVRRRLDQRGYRQPLDASSLPLVESLLNDLIRANDQLNAYHAGHHKPGHHESGFVHHKSSTMSLRPEHSRLVKENLELRQKIARIKDDADREKKCLKLRLRKYEIEQTNHGFGNQEKASKKPQQLERDAKQKSHKMDQIAGNKQDNNDVEQKDRENLLEADTSQQLEQDIYDLNLIQFAEERIHQLEVDLISEKEANNTLIAEFNDLKAQFHEKCEEVERLHNFIDMPRGFKDVDFPHPAHHDHFHGHEQFCHLPQVNLNLEKRLKEALNACQEATANGADLANRNMILDMELKDVDRVSQALRRQKDELVSTADHEMNCAKQELERLQKTVQTLETEIAHLRQGKVQNDGLPVPHDAPNNSQEEKDGVETLRQKISELHDRLQQACLREQELQLKVFQSDEARRPSNNDSSYPQQVISSLEKQRNYYKSHLERLNRLLQERTAPASTSTPLPQFDAQHIFMEEPLIKLLEEERDFYKNECLRFRGSQDHHGGSKDAPDNNKVIELERQLHSVLEEKEELRNTLEQLESVFEETNSSLRAANAEKDKLNSALKQAQRNENGTDCNSRGAFPLVSESTFRNAHEMLEEKNKAKAELEIVSSELQEVRNRLKLATQTQITERARMEKAMVELRSKLVLENGERAELLSKISSHKVIMDSMEEQLKGLQNHLITAEKEIQRMQTEHNQSRTRADQAERALKEAQSLQAQRASDRAQNEETVSDFEMRIEQLNQVIAKQKEDLISLQRSVVALDHDKDALQTDVDNKTENLAALHDELLNKSNEVSDLKTTVTNLELRIDHMLDDFHNKDMDFKAIKRQSDTAQREARTTKRQYEDMLERNQQLREDLMVMTRENQSVHEDLKKSKDNCDNLKAQLQNYVTEVSRVEELLQSKERERADLLEQYHSLTSATSSLELHNSVLEGQASNVRLELMSKESELGHAKQSVEALNREIEEYFRRQQEIDSELVNLRRNLNDSDARNFAVEREKERLERDMSAMRDLCARLDANKEKLVEEVSNKDSELEKVEISLSQLQLEGQQLRSQLSSQHTVVQSLEELLASNRQQVYHTQLANRELNSELTALRNRLSDVENKLEEQSRIATRYRSQVSDFEDEVEQLQRKLTSERFERERLNQELKRSQKSMSPTLPSAMPVSSMVKGPTGSKKTGTGTGTTIEGTVNRVLTTNLRTDLITTRRSVAEPFSNELRNSDRKEDSHNFTSEQPATSASSTSGSTSPDNNNRHHL